MQNNKICDVCSSNSLRIIGEKKYHRDNIKKISQNVSDRFRILFEVWFPESDFVKLKIVLCEECGFVFYTPRPEASDIDQKYYFLNELICESKAELIKETSTELRRAVLLLKYISKNLDVHSVDNVLDFGGHDGRLMKPFIDQGKCCYLVDYTQHSMPGVIRLGDSLADLSEDARFDLVICSHVLEHVATPLQVVGELQRHLTENGFIFIEVPMEMMWQLPMQKEPVTHINFFTPNSLYNLLTLAGFEVLDCRLDSCFHPSGIFNFGIRAIARNVENQEGERGLRDIDLDYYLRPNLLQRIRHLQTNPSVLRRISFRSVRRFFSK